MSVQILTLEREYGSGGNVIAGKVAARLGWKLWDQLLTQEIAKRLDCDCTAVEQHEERRDPAHYRLLKAFMRGSFEGSLNAPRLKMLDADCIRDVTRNLLEEITATGKCVIVGRGSQCVLQDRRDVFHVFLHAPGAGRHPVDEQRARYVQMNFGQEWRNPHLYDLMIDTQLGEERVVAAILAGMGYPS